VRRQREEETEGVSRQQSDPVAINHRRTSRKHQLEDSRTGQSKEGSTFVMAGLIFPSVSRCLLAWVFAVATSLQLLFFWWLLHADVSFDAGLLHNAAGMVIIISSGIFVVHGAWRRQPALFRVGLALAAVSFLAFSWATVNVVFLQNCNGSACDMQDVHVGERYNGSLHSGQNWQDCETLA